MENPIYLISLVIQNGRWTNMVLSGPYRQGLLKAIYSHNVSYVFSGRFELYVYMYWVEWKVMSLLVKIILQLMWMFPYEYQLGKKQW